MSNIVLASKQIQHSPIFAESGNDISRAMTLKDLIERSGLNYHITFDPIRVRGKKVKGILAITRDDTGQVFGIVKKRYEVFQNKQMIERFMKIASITGSKFGYAGTFDGGKTMWITARCQETITIKGQAIGFHMIMMNVHDGKRSGQLLFLPMIESSNTPLMSTKRSSPNKITVNHNFGFDKQLNVDDVIRQKDKYIGDVAQILLDMAKRKVSDTERDQFFNMVVTDRRQISLKTMSVRSANKIAAMTDFYLSHATMKNFVGTAFGLFASVAGYYQIVKRYKEGNAEKRLSNTLLEGDAIKDTLNAFHHASMMI